MEKLGEIVSHPVQKIERSIRYHIRTKKEAVGSVIVQFVSSSTKEKILKSIKTYNKKNQCNRLNTSHLQGNGPKTPIYVSEALTAKSKRLYYLARELVKNSECEQCWTFNGKVPICP